MLSSLFSSYTIHADAPETKEEKVSEPKQEEEEGEEEAEPEAEEEEEPEDVCSSMAWMDN
jgi:ubiquinol-cytochrome c reductase subunit 6